MSPRFTKGPWIIGENINHEYVLMSQSGEHVAYAAWDGGSGCHLQIDNPADAHLIIAAPELYEALELMIADFGDYPASERPCLAFDKAHAALRKARGEQS